MKIKICCISSIAEAKLALAVGAHHLGLVGPMPSGPGTIPLEDIREITTCLEDDVDTWLLTSKTTASEVIEEFQRSGAKSLQLTDKLNDSEVRHLSNQLKGVQLVQVIHVLDELALEEVSSAEQWCDAVLLDSGNPTLAVKQLGGTGKTHNWAISQRIVQRCSVPVYLAGGLGPNNVKAAIEQVQPDGLDLCSGVRVDGHLNGALLEQYIEAINQ